MENSWYILHFFLRKQYRRKLWAGGNLSILCQHEKFSHTLGNKTKTEHCENVLTKFDWRWMGKYSGQFWKLIMALETLNFLGGLRVALQPQESQCCSFKESNLETCPTFCGCYFCQLFKWWTHFALSRVLAIQISSLKPHYHITHGNLISVITMYYHVGVRCYFCQLFKRWIHSALSRVLATLISSPKPHYHHRTHDIAFAFAANLI